MRPGRHPLAELERSLAPWAERAVLVVDQFEELFTLCRDETERTRFLDVLVDLVENGDRRIQVVLAVRADFYGRCATHDRLARLVGANQVLVGPMQRDELRRAIEEPAGRVGLRVEPALTDALIADVIDEPGGLPLLSAALLEQWQARDGRVMRHAAYERTGGVRGAVGRLAEQMYARLSEPEREAARRILLRLADAGETESGALVRRLMPLDEIDPEPDAGNRGGAHGPHRQPARHGRGGEPRGRPRGPVARVAAAARLARGGRRGTPAAPSPHSRGARLGRRRTRAGRAVPRRPPGLGARLEHRPRGRPQRAGARVPRREPRRAGARDRVPAPLEPPPARAARRPGRAARGRAGGRRGGAQPARRGPRRGARRGRPAPRSGVAQPGAAGPGAPASAGVRAARRVPRHARQSPVRADAHPGGDRGREPRLADLRHGHQPGRVRDRDRGRARHRDLLRRRDPEAAGPAV